jgi:hypothetical protein
VPTTMGGQGWQKPQAALAGTTASPVGEPATGTVQEPRAQHSGPIQI